MKALKFASAVVLILAVGVSGSAMAQSAATLLKGQAPTIGTATPVGSGASPTATSNSKVKAPKTKKPKAPKAPKIKKPKKP